MTQYEFDEKESEICRGLGSAIAFVGAAWVVLGVGEGIVGILRFVYHDRDLVTLLVTMGQGVAMFLIGVWFRGAGHAFVEIARTRGNDMGNLMQALIRLRSAFVLQRAALVVLIALLLVAFAFVAMSMAVEAGIPATTS